jgi:hypothetical protein
VKTILTLAFLLLSLFASAQSRLAKGITFQQLAEITGTQAGDYFGLFIAVDGNTLVVGAPYASDNGENRGAAYVYTAANGDWANLTQVATLTPPAGQSGFGFAVAINGDTVVVGDDGAAGAVAYVYVNPSGNAAPTAELTTSASINNGDVITSIGIEGGTIVVGMPAAIPVAHGEGAAFVYVEPPAGWANMTETAELVSTDLNTSFGWSTSISGRNIIVGATQAKVEGVEQGSAYLFVEPAAGWSGTWLPTTEFEASNGTKKAAFGTSVSVSGETVAVGAPDEAVGSADNEGAVYMFTEPSSGWPKTMTETAELSASDAKAGSELGWSVALSGEILVAGAPFERTGQGFVYVFSEPSGGWQDGAQAEQIAASDGSANNNFGYSVSIGGGVIAASAFGWPAGGDSPDGAAYVFGDNN